jgi:hypothetical protein
MVDPLLPTSRTPQPFDAIQPNLLQVLGMSCLRTQVLASYQGVSINYDKIEKLLEINNIACKSLIT